MMKNEQMKTESGNSGLAYAPWGWKDRLRVRLFPAMHCDVPEAPGSFKDCLVMNAETRIGWQDRLRLLVSGRMKFAVKIVTENMVGSHRTKAMGWVAPPSWLERSKRLDQEKERAGLVIGKW